jgi:hypothetical protein
VGWGGSFVVGEWSSSSATSVGLGWVVAGVGGWVGICRRRGWGWKLGISKGIIMNNVGPFFYVFNPNSFYVLIPRFFTFLFLLLLFF